MSVRAQIATAEAIAAAANDEIVMYIVARTDLKMSPGKLGAQIGHAVQYVLDKLETEEGLKSYAPDPDYRKMAGLTPYPTDLTYRELARRWRTPSSAKIVLQVDSAWELHYLFDHTPIPGCQVIDEGRTEIEPNTPTVVGFFPVPKADAKLSLGHLKLYR